MTSTLHATLESAQDGATYSYSLNLRGSWSMAPIATWPDLSQAGMHQVKLATLIPVVAEDAPPAPRETLLLRIVSGPRPGPGQPFVLAGELIGTDTPTALLEQRIGQTKKEKNLEQD